MTKILVIEDHDMLRQEIVQMLELSEFEAWDAPDGMDGLELARREKPDLILCDIMMNPMDGYEVLQSLRQEPAIANTPFIFLTARSDRSSMRQGMALGADDYVTKPFTVTELLEAIQIRLVRHAAVAKAGEKSLEAVRQQLMRMVTHELRTPLTSINMALDIISRQLSSLTPRQLQEMLDTLGSGSKRLNHIVDQIVLITQLKAGILQHETVVESGVTSPLWEIIITAISMSRRFAYRNANANIELLDRDKSALVVCNLMALRHALAELITNAINFSPEDGTITISQWKADDSVWITITDSGPGIAPDQLSRALENFQQINREAQEQQGLGLGLGLAHHLINAHGGTLDLKSVPGKGTQVVVSLPLARETSLSASGLPGH